ncbi:hypothetical protein [Candidatus Tisiphia endosymbiont of Parasteatoda lunata]
MGGFKYFWRTDYLKGVIGDVINPLISAVGLNLRCIANHLLKTNFST